MHLIANANFIFNEELAINFTKQQLELFENILKNRPKRSYQTAGTSNVFFL